MQILPSIRAVLRFALPLAWLLLTVLMTADAADGGQVKPANHRIAENRSVSGFAIHGADR